MGIVFQCGLFADRGVSEVRKHCSSHFSRILFLFSWGQCANKTTMPFLAHAHQARLYTEESKQVLTGLAPWYPWKNQTTMPWRTHPLGSKLALA